MDHDVIVTGSGFGGSVCALRLSEKGYRVAIHEQGCRFQDEDFLKVNGLFRQSNSQTIRVIYPGLVAAI